MTEQARSLSPLDAAEFVVKRPDLEGLYKKLAIESTRGTPLGIAQVAGNKALLMLNWFTSDWLFPARPWEVLDKDGLPILWIEFGGLVRPVVLTVRRPDRSLIGRLIGQTWLTTWRNKGFWVEIDGQRTGEILADKSEYRFVDSARSELGRAEKKPGRAPYTIRYARTTFRAEQPLSEAHAGLALAAAILRHIV
ncbi:hypothetical protein [Rhodococcus sp. HNM0569]|uniref:hypothetical protein n=1 Tax=Rhodococcus sp. HNM0569 TaxID=2716340 RepID=UPI001469B61F|nr:hypothetical protein [Rhodococcus sp. HNM0569]NLU82099.1 hypothetical protein [Rhodococcus sp. HNM0569]